METFENESNEQISMKNEAIKEAADNTAQALDVAIEVLEDIQKMVGSGRPKSLNIKFGDRTVAKMPLALTAAAAFAAGLAAVLLTKLAIEIEHED